MRLCTPYFFCGLILCVYLSNQCAAEEPTPMKLEKLYEEQTVSIEEDGHDVSFRYRLFRPESADSQKKFPLVLFFHGAGERGSDNLNQLKYFPTWMTTKPLRDKYPCFILAPQCREGYRWSAVDMTTDMEAALKALDHVIETEAIDTDQILVKVIPVDCSRSMVAAVKEAGGNPKYTELPGVGHDSWTAAYHDNEILDWFFRQHR